MVDGIGVDAAFDVELDAFFFEHAAFASDFGAVGLAIEAVEHAVCSHYAVARDVGGERVMPQGLTDCLRRKTADRFGHYGVCGHPSSGYLPDRVVDGLLKRRDGWHSPVTSGRCPARRQRANLRRVHRQPKGQRGSCLPQRPGGNCYGFYVYSQDQGPTASRSVQGQFVRNWCNLLWFSLLRFRFWRCDIGYLCDGGGGRQFDGGGSRRLNGWHRL